MSDRRVKRTIRLLREALMSLIIEKGYDSISVQDITDRADLARSTFYLHFKDKDELLYESMREIYSDLLKSVHPGTMDDPADFEHVAEHADFYRIMFSERGSMAFMVKMRGFLTEIMKTHVLNVLIPPEQKTRLPRDFVAHVMAGAQLAMFAWWLENNQKPSAEEIAHMGQELMVNGILWAIGADDEET